jgi:hypothetical protein
VKKYTNEAIRIGLTKRKGVDNGRTNHTEKQILEIREKYSTGNYTQQQLANEYNYRQGHISAIILRQSWKHI